MIFCDGCSNPVPPAGAIIVNESGVQCRYCAECHAEWEAFRVACKAQASVYQRMQEFFEQESRKKLTLNITPLDFPRFWEQRAAPEALVLG